MKELRWFKIYIYIYITAGEEISKDNVEDDDDDDDDDDEEEEEEERKRGRRKRRC